HWSPGEPNNANGEEQCWMRFKDKCFLFKGKGNDIHGTWFFARDWCKDQGANLAIIDSQDENNFVTSYLKDLQHQTWIGLSDLLVENQYWSDGWPVFFTQWGPGEPSNLQDEGCVSMHAAFPFHGTWNDTDCAVAKSYICKISYGTAPSVPGFDDPPRLTGLV
uniref:C-type lectin domain-containing protein n=1 Tax=Salarias fasciatus TaxID=181472 RepID=A0A672FCS0_SALFA